MEPMLPSKQPSSEPLPLPAVLGRQAFLNVLKAPRKTAVSLALFRSRRYDEVRRERGVETAERMMGQLASLLLASLKDNYILGRPGNDSLAVLLPVAETEALKGALFLHAYVRERSRFPVSMGLALAGKGQVSPAELLERARQAAEQAPSAAPAAAPQETDGVSASLAARYQKVVLLNRMALELFADRPFEKSLRAAANILLALLGAKHTSVFFRDALGRLEPALRHGDAAFAEDEARREETAAIGQAVSQKLIITQSGAARSWIAAPLLDAGTGDEGAVAAAWLGPKEADAERDRLLQEAAKLIRNARLLQKVLLNQRTLAAVAEQSADALFVLSLDRRVLNWNRAAEKLFGWKAEEIIGRHGFTLIPEDRRAESDALVAAILDKGTLSSAETEHMRKDGTRIPVEESFALLKDAAGHPYAIAVSCRDITSRKEVERMKSEFVSLVSHELRTPMTAISGFAETLRECGDTLQPEERRRYLGVILEESRRLANLVTNFLDLSKLEAGAMPLKPQPVPLAAMAEKLRALFQNHPSRARIVLHAGPGAESVVADEEQLYRLLLNLVGNALKYTPEGKAVTLSSRRKNGMIEVMVADEGPGLSDDQLKHLFERFYRGPDAISRQSRGTGLGLSICKAIVEAHGGTIRAERAAGGGAAFVFTLPAP